MWDWKREVDTGEEIVVETLYVRNPFINHFVVSQRIIFLFLKNDNWILSQK